MKKFSKIMIASFGAALVAFATGCGQESLPINEPETLPSVPAQIVPAPQNYVGVYDPEMCALIELQESVHGKNDATRQLRNLNGCP